MAEASKTPAQATTEAGGSKTGTEATDKTGEQTGAAATTEAGKTGETTGAAATTQTGAAAAAGETEKKADDSTQAKSEQPAGEKKPDSPKVPDKYDLKLPAGAEAWLDESDLAQISTVAKQHGWTNDEAQARLEEHADALVAQSAAFRAQVEADNDYGGDKLEQTQRLAAQVLDRVRPKGTPRGDALRKILVKSGYGNNLEVVSFLADLGKLMAEDQPTMRSGGGGATNEDAASKLYDHPTSKALAST